MNSTILVTHAANDIGTLFDALRTMLPFSMPVDAKFVAQIQVTIPEKPGATQTVVPPSAESATATPAVVPSAPSPAPSTDEPAKKRGRPKKEPVQIDLTLAPPAEPVKAVDPTPAEPVKAVDPTPAEPVKAVDPTPAAKPTATKDDVRSALHTLVTKHNLELGAAALSRFGARKLSDLKEDQYEAFIAACHKTTESGEA